ncbi:uncharacterized protein LOC125036159 [Penaeus chinensis]|uniref:uncharacterized protein LOC125036159 n=1 Tax=Penaeus chinensis TaxID=139456 RepID=UPI001FB85C4A|nr:uncharacterized protein LOC125036159 [Penaeus chinensis]
MAAFRSTGVSFARISLFLLLTRGSLAQEDPETSLAEFIGDPQDPDRRGYLTREVNWTEPIHKVSLCAKIKVNSLTSSAQVPLLSFSHRACFSELLLVVDTKASELEFRCCDFRVSVRLPIEGRLRANEWEALCFSADLITGHLSFVHRDQRSQWQLNKTQIPAAVRGSGVAVVGSIQNRYDGGLTEGFTGTVASLTLSDAFVSEPEAADFIGDCATILTSGILSVKTVGVPDSGWKLSPGVSLSPLSLQPLCPENLILMLPGRHSHDEAAGFCRSAGGSLPGDDDVVRLRANFNDSVASCQNPFGAWLWLGPFKLYKQEQWTLVTSDVQSGSAKLCRSVNPKEDARVDLPCEERVCAACLVPRRPVLTLRLGCEEVWDRVFSYVFENSGPPQLVSAFGSSISWEADLWTLKNTEGTVLFTTGEAGSTRLTLPLGTHSWTKQHSDLQCPMKTQILLSLCDSDRLSCDDGLTCLPTSSKCDQVADCSDGSDERDCTPTPRWERDSTLPPPPLSPNDTTHINLLVTAFSLEALEPTTFAVEARVSLELQWNDPRVTFHNLLEGETPVPPQADMWVPLLEGMWAPSEVTRIAQAGQASLAAVRTQHEPKVNLSTQDLKYSGRWHPWELRQTHLVSSSCQFQLLFHPFDVQRCKLSLSFQNLGQARIKLSFAEPRNKAFKTAKGQILNNYAVKEVTMEEGEQSDLHPSVTFTLTLRHNGVRALAVVHIPTCLLVFLTYAVLFVPVHYVRTRLLTTVLCLVGVALVFWGASLSRLVHFHAQVTFLGAWVLIVFVFISFAIVFEAAVAIALSVQRPQAGTKGKWDSRVIPFEPADSLEDDPPASSPTSLPNLINLTAQVLLGIAGLAAFLWYLIYGAVQPGSMAAADE